MFCGFDSVCGVIVSLLESGFLQTKISFVFYAVCLIAGA